MPKLVRWDLVNVKLVKELPKAVCLRCEVLEGSHYIEKEIWFPKSQCKLIDNTWQVTKNFMKSKVAELGTSIRATDIWK